MTELLDSFVRPADDFVAGAACRGLPTEWWFPTQGMNLVRTPTLRTAKELCATCAVKRECYEYGVATESWGIWGGVTLNDGRTTNRGRDRRDDNS
jgi:WhiB family redox-sensing transcriptional regulator